jgi:CXXX repeat radical SAM target protein
MKEKNKTEEILSRREFFKNTAKKALPILAGIALVSAPSLITTEAKASDCRGSSCTGACKNTCTGGCDGGCGTTCSGKCLGKCDGVCKDSCYNNCTGGSKK